MVGVSRCMLLSLHMQSYSRKAIGLCGSALDMLPPDGTGKAGRFHNGTI